MKFSIVKKIYTFIKPAKVVIASLGAFIAIRVIAKFDYWALILTDSLPQLPFGTKTVLSGIRRLRLAGNDFSICISQSNEI